MRRGMLHMHSRNGSTFLYEIMSDFCLLSENFIEKASTRREFSPSNLEKNFKTIFPPTPMVNGLVVVWSVGRGGIWAADGPSDGHHETKHCLLRRTDDQDIRLNSRRRLTRPRTHLATPHSVPVQLGHGRFFSLFSDQRLTALSVASTDHFKLLHH